MTEGDGSARNFRSAYYEKLGFCGNDEKNYLDILIEASPFDSEKLNELCERPELDRKCIEAWKILLGVECSRKNPFDDYANVKRHDDEQVRTKTHEDENNARKALQDQNYQCKHHHNLAPSRQLHHHHHDQEEDQHKNQTRAGHARLITMMYLLETGKLDTLDMDGQLKSEECRKLLVMASFFVNVADDLQEAFFLFRNFTNHIRNKTNS